ncbi:MAG: peroxidase family protein [Acidobacteriota bacterium]
MFLLLSAGIVPVRSAAQEVGATGDDRSVVSARSRAAATERSFRDEVAESVSPVRGIERDRDAGSRPPTPPAPAGFRTIDGTMNNPGAPDMGSIGVQLVRMAPADYGDGISSMGGEGRPSPRAVSNAVCAQAGATPNSMGATDYLWQWGQFLDHDLDLTDGTDPPEPADIEVPIGDPFFDPFGTGEATISLNRSLYDASSGTSSGNPRQQVNEITAWIDASNVYGSEEERAHALRTLDGTGRLKTSAGDLLPFNVEGLPNAGGPAATLFLAGDVRANEQVGLATMHTLFVREHNRLADEIRARQPGLAGDEIYERARRLVGAMMQVITYEEFLPLLLGDRALPPYQGYDASREASIANEFSTAAYRFGHSALNTTLMRIDASGEEIAEGHLELRDAFFAPQRLVDEGGLEPVLRGLASQACQAIDTQVVDDVRNFLFGPPGSGGFDLASLNIQRGRDHGLASYNDLRRRLGLRPARRWSDISSNRDVTDGLRSVYSSIDQVDAWVGGLAEDPESGAMVGELIGTVLSRQFLALRDGDAYWYERTLDRQELDMVRDTRLADVIRRNTTIGREISDDVFRLRTGGDPGGPGGPFPPGGGGGGGGGGGPGRDGGPDGPRGGRR